MAGTPPPNQNSPAKAKATWYTVWGTNDVGWRAEIPARELGARVELIPKDEMMGGLAEPHDHGPCRWHLQVDWPDGTRSLIKTPRGYKRVMQTGKPIRVRKITALFPDHQGTAVWTLPSLAQAALAKSMREQHTVRTLAEVDDNYFADPKLTLAFRADCWGEREQDEHAYSVFSQDAIVFATSNLRDIYAREIRKYYNNWFGKGARAREPEFHVCRNHLPLDLWPDRIERDPVTERIRVGWMGSTSHLWDVDLAWPALLYAKQNGAEPWMVGYDPVKDPLISAAGTALKPRAQDKVNQWRKVGYQTLPWRKLKPLERVPLPFDIGLCPLRWDAMTEGKSDVKSLEYWVNGACPVAWNHPVYNKTVKHMENGLLVGSPSEMIDAVALLMRDEGLRQRLVEAGQHYVREERGAKQLKEEWGHAIAG